MAGTIQSFTPAAWDNRVDTLANRLKCKIALEGAAAVPLGIGASDAATDLNRVANGILADILAARQSGEPDFFIEARTDASETFAVAELLTARGVQFPANSKRILQIDVYASGQLSTEQQWFRGFYSVQGGATPVVDVATLNASTPAQIPGNFMSSAAAGFAGNNVTVVAGAGTLTVNVVSAEAEIVNWRVEIRIGKLQTLTQGV